MRVQVAETSRAEQESRDANYQAQLERLQLAQELRATLERQGAILDALPMALYEAVLDERGVLARKFVGGDISNLTGLSSDDLDAEPWEGRIHPDDKLRVSAPASDEAQLRHAMEYRWIGPDNVSRHFLDQRVRISGDAQGERWAGTLVDITEQKLLEAQLLHARKMDAIGQLTGGVAHDFNNLLSAVLGGIHLLERRVQLGERDQLVLQQMRHAAEQGAELVRRMMAFARKQDLSPTSVDPRSLCQSVAGLIEHTLAGTVSITWACADDVPNLFVDRAQLELALVNLIINARDAMPQGGQIEINIDAIDVEGTESTRVRVSDQGEGIPDELIGRITEPFFTTKEAGKGTGLGLSMVAGFVQQSGGRLMIDSEPGNGTTIDLILPSTAQPTAVVDNSVGKAPRVAPSSRAVLLVDDDEAVRTVLAEQLREVGFRVDIATDGNSAISRLESDDGYDVLLTDFAMPGMNGAEVARAARALAPALPIIFVTGFAQSDQIDADFADVPLLRKPFGIAALASEIRNALPAATRA
jgi:signal transduction histidine kinase/CheY-like chemotaxis protein